MDSLTGSVAAGEIADDNNVDNGFNAFLSLPPEIRIRYILPRFHVSDRKKLRAVCKQLAIEIDYHVMPVKTLQLKSCYTETKKGFIAGAFFSELEDNQNTSFWRIHSLCQYLEYIAKTVVKENPYDFLEYNDQFKLQAFKFLIRHPQCTNVEVKEEINLPDIPLTDTDRILNQLRSINYYQSANAETPFGPSPAFFIPSCGQLRIKKFRFQSNWNRFDSKVSEIPLNLKHWFDFLKNLTTLEDLEFLYDCGDRITKPWNYFSAIILQNCEKLVKVHIKFELVAPVSFSAFAKCSCLKHIFLEDQSKRAVWHGDPTYIEDFGPHQNMIDNLEVLNLKNLRLHIRDFESLHLLKKLKIFWVDGSSWEDDRDHRHFFLLSSKGLQNILGMRTLDDIDLYTTFLLPHFDVKNETFADGHDPVFYEIYTDYSSG